MPGTLPVVGTGMHHSTPPLLALFLALTACSSGGSEGTLGSAIATDTFGDVRLEPTDDVDDDLWIELADTERAAAALDAHHRQQGCRGGAPARVREGIVPSMKVRVVERTLDCGDDEPTTLITAFDATDDEAFWIASYSVRLDPEARVTRIADVIDGDVVEHEQRWDAPPAGPTSDHESVGARVEALVAGGTGTFVGTGTADTCTLAHTFARFDARDAARAHCGFDALLQARSAATELWRLRVAGGQCFVALQITYACIPGNDTSGAGSFLGSGYYD